MDKKEKKNNAHFVEEVGCYGDGRNQWRKEKEIKRIKMSSGDTVRDQFSALQRQQKERLNQLQEKSTKKKVSTVDVSLSF